MADPKQPSQTGWRALQTLDTVTHTHTHTGHIRLSLTHFDLSNKTKYTVKNGSFSSTSSEVWKIIHERIKSFLVKSGFPPYLCKIYLTEEVYQLRVNEEAGEQFDLVL